MASALATLNLQADASFCSVIETMTSLVAGTIAKKRTVPHSNLALNLVKHATGSRARRVSTNEASMTKNAAISILALSAMLLLSSCGYTKIGRITADPTRFRNQTVRVEGRVTNSFGALSVGGYQIQDDTGKIFVLSNRGVPSSGSKVAVSGTVMEGVTVMGRSFGTTIQEHNHRVRGN